MQSSFLLSLRVMKVLVFARFWLSFYLKKLLVLLLPPLLLRRNLLVLLLLPLLLLPRRPRLLKLPRLPRLPRRVPRPPKIRGRSRANLLMINPLFLALLPTQRKRKSVTKRNQRSMTLTSLLSLILSIL